MSETSHPYLEQHPEAEQDLARAYEIAHASKEHVEAAALLSKQAIRSSQLADEHKDEVFGYPYSVDAAGYSEAAAAREKQADQAAINAGEEYDSNKKSQEK